MKLLVTGENLKVLMEIVNSLRNFDNIVTLRFTGRSMLFIASDAFDRNIEHKFEPPFYVTDSEEKRETMVTTKKLIHNLTKQIILIFVFNKILFITISPINN